jgi:hypothetical protein
MEEVYPQIEYLRKLFLLLPAKLELIGLLLDGLRVSREKVEQKYEFLGWIFLPDN